MSSKRMLVFISVLHIHVFYCKKTSELTFVLVLDVILKSYNYYSSVTEHIAALNVHWYYIEIRTPTTSLFKVEIKK